MKVLGNPPFGLLFQMPVLIMFLTRLGVITPRFLSKIRKYAYFVLLVIAAMIAPPELLSHLMITIPLCILYEISILISKAAYRKRQTGSESDQDIEIGIYLSVTLRSFSYRPGLTNAQI